MSIPQIDIAPFLAGDPAGRQAVARQWAQAFETVGPAVTVIVTALVDINPYESVATAINV